MDSSILGRIYLPLRTRTASIFWGTSYVLFNLISEWTAVRFTDETFRLSLAR